jgi:hypothetical protein
MKNQIILPCLDADVEQLAVENGCKVTHTPEGNVVVAARTAQHIWAVLAIVDTRNLHEDIFPMHRYTDLRKEL